ncbi:response regulator [Stieleria varia]|uniref:Response regulator rcp1 n=1 Tax=Stieleria varia TaxID=2528005 RepID=A0A5C6AYB5_9BACT|nr:response regulator [Stieleria varia]TWU04477.1 Response regulator rcp1 [Stieleria varia]
MKISNAVVLLVEDNADDAYLTSVGFKRSDHDVTLHHVSNGEQCMEFLRKKGRFVDAPTPDIVLLDLNMPVMDGREVLAEISQDERLRRIRLLVLTTSDSPQDLAIAYEHGCASYIVKPFDLHDLQHTVDQICDYWFDITSLPTKA